MARSAGTAVTNSFVKGLITEATGLNFPEDAVTETDNCIFERTGNVTRRLGIDYEASYVTNAETLEGSAVTEYLWKSAALNGEILFLVLQIGESISFYRLDGGETLSTGLEAFGVDLTDFQVAGAPDVGDISCSFAAGNGVLFVTHPYCEPFYVEYDPVGNGIAATEISVQIRDMRGLDQSGSVAEYNTRPPTGSITDTIKYNLLNQGWVQGCSLVVGSVLDIYNNGQIADNSGRGYVAPANAAKSSGLLPALDRWFTPSSGYHYDVYHVDYIKQVVYPSEAETWWLYQYPSTKAFDPSNITSFPTPPNAPVAKGHFIYNAFYINRADTAIAEYTANAGALFSNLTLEVESSGYFRPSQVAFFAGRAFYAGVPSTNYGNKIFFTKVTEQAVDYGKCHQQLDPTGEEAGDLVASDGGVIVIPEMAQVIKLFTAGTNLFVFATNGIWKISGSLGNTGFAANAYAISRISVINTLSPLSFVDVDGMPVWWNNDGIWTLKADQLGTSVQVTPISLDRIASFLEDISAENRQYVKGAFNPFTRIVQWIYRSDAATSVEGRYQYDSILNYDITSGSFYPWSLPTDALSRIAGIIVPQGTVAVREDEVVTAEGVTVTAEAIDVTVTRIVSTATSSIFKYIVSTVV